MPTLRPQQPHQARDMAESFGLNAERYDRTRPPYPAQMVERIVAASPGRDFVDVGAGTGIAARQFQAAGCAVLGVEPDPLMADFARARGLPVEVATFEDWEPAGRTFDAVVAGTAWHWVDPVAGAAKAAEVLRPGGRLAPFWHVLTMPAEIVDALAEVYPRLMPERPLNHHVLKQGLDAYQVVLTRAADGIRQVGGFTEPEQWQYEWERYYTRDEWLDQMPTQGALNRLAPDKLAELLAATGEAIDAMGGGFTLPYTTAVVTATRT